MKDFLSRLKRLEKKLGTGFITAILKDKSVLKIRTGRHYVNLLFDLFNGRRTEEIERIMQIESSDEEATGNGQMLRLFREFQKPGVPPGWHIGAWNALSEDEQKRVSGQNISFAGYVKNQSKEQEANA